jgi:hypothetical protein
MDANFWGQIQIGDLSNPTLGTSPPSMEHCWTEGRIIQPVKWPPADISELEQYLRVVDDFVQRHEYKIPSMLILQRLTKSVVAWKWIFDVKAELIILSNVVG